MEGDSDKRGNGAGPPNTHARTLIAIYKGSGARLGAKKESFPFVSRVFFGIFRKISKSLRRRIGPLTRKTSTRVTSLVMAWLFEILNF